jgi:hypothetical protein|tara:strand:- start:320 stop:790 length:471 start_codon:yes stop_codon:yes gene_type:complete
MSEKKNDHMNLWNKVETTDPEFTTTVNQRGGFTAIGAQYQIKNATEVFGPFGAMWGVKDENYELILSNQMVLYTATFWYKHEGKSGEFPIASSIKTMMGKRVDDDCIKKVQTDALTKGLSKLGFNADVFMGRFDDNKYVATDKVQQSIDDKAEEWI